MSWNHLLTRAVPPPCDVWPIMHCTLCNWDFFIKMLSSTKLQLSFLSFYTVLLRNRRKISQKLAKRITLVSLSTPLPPPWNERKSQNRLQRSTEEREYCKVTNVRPVPIFVLLNWNWFVRTNFRTFEGQETKSHWNSRVSKQKRNFHTV